MTSPTSKSPDPGDAVLVMRTDADCAMLVTVSSFTKDVSGSSLRATTSFPFGSLAVALIKFDTLPVLTVA